MVKTKELKSIINKLKSSRDIKSKFKSLGFKKSKDNTSVYINDKYVFKNTNHITLIGKKPKKSVPHLNIKLKGDIYMIQPRVLTLEELNNNINGSINSLTGFGKDAHSGNIGIYKGKLVQYDW